MSLQISLYVTILYSSGIMKFIRAVLHLMTPEKAEKFQPTSDLLPDLFLNWNFLLHSKMMLKTT